LVGVRVSFFNEFHDSGVSNFNETITGWDEDFDSRNGGINLNIDISVDNRSEFGLEPSGKTRSVREVVTVDDPEFLFF